MKFKYIKRIIIGLLLVICNISCDQVTKKQVRENIDPHERIEIINDNFILTKVENTGAALSFGDNFSPTVKLIIFQLLPVLVLLYLFYYLMKNNEISKMNFVAITFIIGGGIGNIIDRILYHSVTDFMYIEIGPFHTGVFNMADFSVTVGGIVLLIGSFFGKKSRLQKSQY